MKKTVLVTGCDGYIGFPLTLKLVKLLTHLLTTYLYIFELLVFINICSNNSNVMGSH